MEQMCIAAHNAKLVDRVSILDEHPIPSRVYQAPSLAVGGRIAPPEHAPARADLPKFIKYLRMDVKRKTQHHVWFVFPSKAKKTPLGIAWSSSGHLLFCKTQRVTRKGPMRDVVPAWWSNHLMPQLRKGMSNVIDK
jgi:hypothetical protein